MHSKQAKGQCIKDPIADLFADEDLHIPGIRALPGDLRRKRHETPQKSVAFTLRDEMLEADLTSQSHCSSDLERSSPRKPRSPSSYLLYLFLFAYFALFVNQDELHLPLN
jgi:hypothetical protein